MTTDQAGEKLVGYDAIDSQGKKLGSVDVVYLDTDTGTPEFYGIKTGWLHGISVVPAAQAQIDESNQTIRLPYESDKIKAAPDLGNDSEVSVGEERRLFEYYGLSAGTTAGMYNADYNTSNMNTANANMTNANMTDVNMANANAADMNSANMNRNAAPTDLNDRSLRDTRGLAGQEDVSVPLTEERISVGKRQVESGHVRLRKVVRTEHATVPVELRREDVIVERVPADRAAAPGEAFQEKVIDVGVVREEPVVQKEAYVTGEVRVRKTAETETRNVEGDVRKEDVVMEKDGREQNFDNRTTQREDVNETTGERITTEPDRTYNRDERSDI